CGDAACLCSVAHGAGRRMGRNEAIEKLRDRYTRASLTYTALGGRVMCADRDLLYAEHPDAYKAIEPVIASLEAAGAARRMAALSPIVTVKR
ncbi:MAG: release factor H-coupled RctB family protein, partial [Myxococcota bacterium]